MARHVGLQPSAPRPAAGICRHKEEPSHALTARRLEEVRSNLFVRASAPTPCVTAQASRLADKAWRVWGVGFRVEGLGLRVEGLGFRV